MNDIAPERHTITLERHSREFEIELPIGHLDADGRLHRTAALRKMTGRDEAIMADKNNRNNAARMITELLANCLIRIGDIEKPGRSIVQQLYSGDRYFLLMKLREITFGPDMQASYSCPTCREANGLIEDLSALEVLRLGDGELPEERFEGRAGLGIGVHDEVVAERRVAVWRQADPRLEVIVGAVREHLDRLALVIHNERAADAAPAGPGPCRDGADVTGAGDPHAEVARRR